MTQCYCALRAVTTKASLTWNMQENGNNNLFSGQVSSSIWTLMTSSHIIQVCLLFVLQTLIPTLLKWDLCGLHPSLPDAATSRDAGGAWVGREERSTLYKECQSFTWQNGPHIDWKQERTLNRRVHCIGRAHWHCGVMVLKAHGEDRHSHF